MGLYSQEYVIENMMSLLEGKTVIVIAHRYSSIRRCDYVYMLGEGCVKEQGTPEELMERKQSYYQMFTKEFTKALSD